MEVGIHGNEDELKDLLLNTGAIEVKVTEKDE
jgi:hypothetical protein